MMAMLRILKLKVWVVLYLRIGLTAGNSVVGCDAPSITLLCGEVSQEITSHFRASSPSQARARGCLRSFLTLLQSRKVQCRYPFEPVMPDRGFQTIGWSEYEYQREYKAKSHCRYAACHAGVTGDRGSAGRQIRHGSGRRHCRKVACGVEFPQPGKNASSVYRRRLLRRRGLWRGESRQRGTA